IFAVSTSYEIDGATGQLDQTHFATAREETVRLNSDGFRVVAVAYKTIDVPKDAYTVTDECDLTLLGYIAFLDPPKESAGAAIAALADKGVKVKILTRDNEIITRKICREVHIDAGEIVLGAQLDQLADQELADLADRSTVFAKPRPRKKSASCVPCIAT